MGRNAHLTALHEHRETLDAAARDAVARLIRREVTLAADRPDQLRVGVLGAFKAGKSTLINALLGADVAATDDLELTAAVVTFIDGDPAVGVFVERESGATEVVELEEFTRRSADVRKDPEWWSTVVSCEVPCGAHAIQLIDTPGTGVITPGRERRAREALEKCDAVVWVLAADNVGEASEAALLRAVQASGMPLVVALNKVDLLSAGDRREVREWITTAFPWAGDRVFEVAAKDGPTEAGIGALRTFLSKTLPRDARGVRRRAYEAATALFDADVDKIRSEVIRRLLPGVERVEQQLRVLERRGDSVRARLVEMLRRKIFEEFLGDLQAKLESDQSELSSEQIAIRINDALTSSQTKDFWGELLSRLPGDVIGEWQAELGAIGDEADASLRAFAESFFADVQARYRASAGAESEIQSAIDLRDVTLIGTAAIAGAGYVAWLGSAAAAVSFGTALAVIALPVAGAGLAIVGIRHVMAKQASAAQRREMVAVLVHEVRQRIWKGYVEIEVLPRIEAVHSELLKAARSHLAGSDHDARRRLLEEVGARYEAESGSVRLLKS